MKTHRLLLLAALALSTSGCFRIRYITNAPAESTPALEKWHHNIIAGLVELSDPVNVAEACPQGFAEVRNEVTFLNFLASAAVQSAAYVPIAIATNNGGTAAGYVYPVQLWSPQSVTVTCARVQAPLAPSQQ